MATTQPTGLGSGLDIDALVNSIIEASSGRLRKLQAKQQGNQDTMTLNNKVMEKVSSVRSAFEKVQTSAQNPTATAATVSESMASFVSAFNELNQMGKGANREIRDTISLFKTQLLSRVNESDLGGLTLLGLGTTRDGGVSFDSSKFQNVWESNKREVASTITSVNTNLTSSAFNLAGYGSILGKRNLSLLSSNARLTSQIESEEKALDQKKERLFSEYARMDAAVVAMNSLGQKFNQLG